MPNAEKAKSAVIIRRVRLDLPGDLPTPFRKTLAELPYARWLKEHVAEVSALKDGSGGTLLSGVYSRMAQTENGAAFITDFYFPSQAAFDYYNTHWLPVMRGRIEEAYPGASAAGSPFSYSIATNQDAAKFSALLDGVGHPRDIARTGSV